MADFQPKRSPEEIKQVWQDDLPVCAAEAAIALGVNRTTVREWCNMSPPLPRVGRFLRRSDYEAWWKRASRAQARRKAAKAKPEASPKVIEFPMPEKRVPPQARELLARATAAPLPPKAAQLMLRASAL
jgi:hypothetical protein